MKYIIDFYEPASRKTITHTLSLKELVPTVYALLEREALGELTEGVYVTSYKTGKRVRLDYYNWEEYI